MSISLIKKVILRRKMNDIETGGICECLLLYSMAVMTVCLQLTLLCMISQNKKCEQKNGVSASYNVMLFFISLLLSHTILHYIRKQMCNKKECCIYLLMPYGLEQFCFCRLGGLLSVFTLQMWLKKNLRERVIVHFFGHVCQIYTSLETFTIC